MNLKDELEAVRKAAEDNWIEDTELHSIFSCEADYIESQVDDFLDWHRNKENPNG